ncbi:MAG: hypothetical protein KGJ80_15660 [Chloroflexota bacterium]|nr:hypothetical protein [Chloroflexota bacterium]
MRNGLVLAGIAFAVALAVLVGNRLSNEAMAVVVGAVCGISASVPVSLALVIAASRNWGRGETPREVGSDSAARHYAPPPQILVVSPPQPYPSPYGFSQSQYYLPPGAPAEGAPRDFKIIGDE